VPNDGIEAPGKGLSEEPYAVLDTSFMGREHPAEAIEEDIEEGV
jgi:hypothetical protein